MKIVVLHMRYNCETGCCGHVVEVDGEEKFHDFVHPYGTEPQKWAEELVRVQFGEEHVRDLDWENCRVYDHD